MAYKAKKLMIVDDSEIDRDILEEILKDDFDIVKVSSGFAAMEMLVNKVEQIDGILLDISMPVMDGFAVLQMMEENKIRDVPVFMITAEATRFNVTKATQYNIKNFIVKPFVATEVIQRLRSYFHITDHKVLVNAVSNDSNFSQTDYDDMLAYIRGLKRVYLTYLQNNKIDYSHYDRMVELVKMIMPQYIQLENVHNISNNSVQIIAQAAFFVDMGKMLLPIKIAESDNYSSDEEALYKKHTEYGKSLVSMNRSSTCKYFIKICSDMCMHHHEYYNGTGYPNSLKYNEHSDITQIATLAEMFDNKFMSYGSREENQFDMAINEIASEDGLIKPSLINALKGAKGNVLLYYKKVDSRRR